VITRNKKIHWSRCSFASGVPSHPIFDEKRYVSYVLNTVLAGYEFAPVPENREEQGLVYSIYSDLNPYRDTGCLANLCGNIT